MKNFFYLMTLAFIVCGIPATIHAQSVAINTDGSAPDASAILDLKSTDKGVLVPRMTAVQRMAIVNPARGLLVFQTEPVPAFCYYNGTVWVNLSDGSLVGSTGYSSNYGYVTTLAGGDVNTSLNGVGPGATIGVVIGMGTDAAGTLYIVEDGAMGGSIRKISSTGIASTWAGTANVSGYIDAAGTAARFKRPTGIVLDAAGNAYVADNLNRCVRKITPTGIVTTYAGDPNLTGDVDGDSTSAGFRDPYGITIDVAGNLYVSEKLTHTIRKIDTDRKVTTIGGVAQAPGLENTADNLGYTLFDGPAGLALDAAGNVYVADEGNHCIRMITPAGDVSTFAGSDSTGNADGPLASALFNRPTGITIDGAGNLFVADWGNHKIRKISPDGIVSTFAGSGLRDHADGPDLTASFDGPLSLALDRFGNLYIGEINRIRKITIR